MDKTEKRPKINEVIEGGPADRAGIKANDLIEQIEGVDTEGMSLRDAVDRLRGDAGTTVTVKVRQSSAATARTYTITRGTHPRDDHGLAQAVIRRLGLPDERFRSNRLPSARQHCRKHAARVCARLRPSFLASGSRQSFLTCEAARAIRPMRPFCWPTACSITARLDACGRIVVKHATGQMPMQSCGAGRSSCSWMAARPRPRNG